MTNLKAILEEIENIDRSIIVTLPASVEWSDYEKEINKVADGSNVMNFKVHSFPKGIKKGDKCYLTHRGFVKGWMEIVGFSEKSFDCNTTGKSWTGKFIERSGKFHYLDKTIPYKGFQGYRYFNIEDYKNL